MSTSAATAPPRRQGAKALFVAVAVVAAAVAIGGMLYLRTWPPIATVMSASMEPSINTGDVVLLGRLDRPARIGDIVAVNVPDTARTRYGYPPVVIHRIVSITPAGQIQTKGDARQQKDPFTVSRRAVTEHVVGTIPAAGRIFAFLVSPLGLIWLVGGALLLFGMPLVENRREQQQREQQTLEDMRLELQAMAAELRGLRAYEPAPEAAPAIELEPEPEFESEPEAEVESELEAEFEFEAEAEWAAEPEPEMEPEPEPEAQLRVVEELLVDDIPEWDPHADLAAVREREASEELLVPHYPVIMRRRSGGLVGYARSLSSRYR